VSAPRWFNYQWTRNGIPISGAVSSTYVLQDLDSGNSIGAIVTAANYAGSVQAAASPEMHVQLLPPRGKLILVEGGDIAAFVAHGPPTTFDPAKKIAAIALSGGNLIAKATSTFGSGGAAVASVRGHSSGKYHCEFHPNKTTAGYDAVGLINSSYVFASGNFIGSAHSVGFYQDGRVFIENAVISGGSHVTWGLGNTVSLAVDLDNRKAWLRVDGGSWNGTTDNPATNVGGFDITATVAAGPVYPAIDFGFTNDQVTANFGGSAYAYTPPSGFVNW
jgi:hypothetical protein